MNKYKKMILVCLTLLVFLTACAADETGGASDDSVVLSVGLLLPGTIDDASWNASAYNGLKMIEEEYGANISYAEQVAQSDNEEVMRNYAENFDVVYGHGFEYFETAEKIADDYPDTYFIVNSAQESYGSNVACLDVASTETGYLSGVLAALTTKTDKVFSLGGIKLNTLIHQFEYFEKGVRSVNPDIEIRSAFTGNGDDATAAFEQTKAFLNEGCDIGIVNANQASFGAYEAIGEDGDALTIGVVADIRDAVPGQVPASFTQNYPQAMLYVYGQIMKDQFEAKYYELGVNEGSVSFIYDEDVIDPANKEAIDAIMDELRSGDLVL